MGMRHRPGHGELRRRTARLLVVTGTAALLSAAAAVAVAALSSPGGEGGGAVAHKALAGTAAASPAGFWYGTDSATITIPGPTPYREPVIGGPYGGYIGMAGNWANLAGCRKIVVWSAANSA